MKFNPNTLKTKDDAQLELINQGYQEDALESHPILNLYDNNNGEMTPAAKGKYGLVMPVVDVARIGLVAKMSQSNVVERPTFVTSHDGVVLLAEEIAEAQDPHSNKVEVGRY